MVRQSCIFLILATSALLCSPEDSRAGDSPVGVEYREPAFYPGSARRAGLAGRVGVVVVVAASGSIRSVAVRGAAHPLLARYAKLAAWLSRFRPATHDGGAVEDSLYLEYGFGRGANGHVFAGDEPHRSREQVVELRSHQVCLYGHWLSGPAVIRKSEDRVFIDGIRVHPPIASLDAALNDGYRLPAVVAEALRFECRLFERELALRGIPREEIRLRTARMAETYRRVAAAGTTQTGIRVDLEDGGRLEIALPDPGDGEVYRSQQPRMEPAEDVYFSWLARLHPGVGRRFVIFADGVSQSMSLENATAGAIRGFLEERRGTGVSRPADGWPPEVESMPPVLRALIHDPLQAARR